MASRINWGGQGRASRERIITEYVNRAIFMGTPLEIGAIKKVTYELMNGEELFKTCLKWKKKGIEGFYGYSEHSWIEPFIQRIVDNTEKTSNTVTTLKKPGYTGVVLGSALNTGNTVNNSSVTDSLEDLKTSESSGYVKYILIGIGILVVIIILKKNKN